MLDGVLERVTFCNPETGYTIARLAPDRGTGRGPVSAATELVTVVGPLLAERASESISSHFQQRRARGDGALPRPAPRQPYPAPGNPLPR